MIVKQLNSVDGFPTLLIVKDKDADPIMYKGDRTKQDIIKFMTDNLDIKPKKGGKKTRKNHKSKKRSKSKRVRKTKRRIKKRR